jgi:hypothetical protein
VFFFLSISLCLIRDRSISIDHNSYKLFLANNSNLNGNNSNFEINKITINSLVMYEEIPNGLSEKNLWYLLLDVGDILVLDYDNKLVMKRIIFINRSNDEYYFTLDNDNSDIKEKKLILSSNDNNIIIGKVRGKKRIIGKIVALKKDIKYHIVFIYLPLSLFIIVELFYYEKNRRKSEKS